MEVYEGVIHNPISKKWAITHGKGHITYTCKGVCVVLSNYEVFVEHENRNVLSSFEFLPEDIAGINLGDHSADITTKGGIYVSLPMEEK